MPAPSTSPITKTVSIGRVIAGRSGVSARPLTPATVEVALMDAAYPGTPLAMTQPISGRPTSLWMDTAPHTTYAQLERTLDVDVCIVGGGVLGLLCADLLRRSGARVAVLEAGRIA